MANANIKTLSDAASYLKHELVNEIENHSPNLPISSLKSFPTLKKKSTDMTAHKIFDQKPCQCDGCA